MTENRPAKGPNVFERLKTKAVRGWEKLKTSWSVFREETRLEGGLVKEAYGEIKESVTGNMNRARDALRDSGDSFGERLRNVTGNAWNGFKEGISNLGHWATERAHDLRDRYQKEGIFGATLGIVSTAIDEVRQLPAKVAGEVNKNMAFVQDEKMIVLKAEKKDVTKKRKINRPEGWEERVQVIDTTYSHIKDRREMFLKRFSLCQERLMNMKAGKARLEAAKTLTPAIATG